MIELEKTYLVRSLPPDLQHFPHERLLDVYFPDEVRHPRMRLRKKGETMELTKKVPVVEGGDGSSHYEYTITLDADEYKALATIPGKRVEKLRYAYQWQGRPVEIDIFLGSLAGLVMADIEFESRADFDQMAMPEFCLADVTHEDLIRGGELCGRSYADLQPLLDRYGYRVLN